MVWIQLEDTEGKTHYINPQQVVRITDGEDARWLAVGGGLPRPVAVLHLADRETISIPVDRELISKLEGDGAAFALASTMGQQVEMGLHKGIQVHVQLLLQNLPAALLRVMQATSNPLRGLPHVGRG